MTTTAMVIRVDDEVTWPNRPPLANHAGRVIEVGYETVKVVPYGRDLSYTMPLDLSEIRVNKPRLHAGDIVILAPNPDRPHPGLVQGVVQPVRWLDGLRGHTVHWEDHDDNAAAERGELLRNHRRYLAQELIRVPIPDQHPELWPAAETAAN